MAKVHFACTARALYTLRTIVNAMTVCKSTAFKVIDIAVVVLERGARRAMVKAGNIYYRHFDFINTKCVIDEST